MTTAHGVRDVRRRAGRRRGRRGRPRRRRGRDQRAAGRHLRDHPDRARPHRVARRHDRATSRWPRSGIIHTGATRDLRRCSRRRRWSRSWSAAPRSARRSPARAASSACCAATLAVGGQVLTLQGLGGVYDEIFLPLHGAHQAQNAALALAAVEAFLGAGAGQAARRRSVVREGFAGVDLARPAGAGAHRADDPGRRRAQPARHGGHGRPRWRRSSPSAGWSRWSRCWPTRTWPACSSCSSRSSTRSSSPATPRRGRCRPTSWPTLADGDLRRGPGDGRAPTCRTRSRRPWRSPRPMWTAS